jgi:hypothetical protein
MSVLDKRELLIALGAAMSGAWRHCFSAARTDDLPMSFKVVHKDPKRHILFACGFSSRERAQAWIDAYNPELYTDKSILRADLTIVEEKR